MGTDRRYSEAEVAEILDRASSGDVTAAEAVGQYDLTLAEIQEIGREVGIRSEDVSAAAHALVRGRHRTPMASMRRRATIKRVVELRSIPTDAQWDRMVVDLREVIGTPGAVERSGSLRSWHGAGVEVHGEPVGAGYRIRIVAKNENAAQSVIGGGVSVVVGFLMAGAMVAAGTADAVTIGASALVVATGVGMASWGRFALVRWTRRMKRQLDQVTSLLRGSARGEA